MFVHLLLYNTMNDTAEKQPVKDASATSVSNGTKNHLQVSTSVNSTQLHFEMLTNQTLCFGIHSFYPQKERFIAPETTSALDKYIYTELEAERSHYDGNLKHGFYYLSG